MKIPKLITMVSKPKSKNEYRLHEMIDGRSSGSKKGFEQVSK